MPGMAEWTHEGTTVKHAVISGETMQKEERFSAFCPVVRFPIENLAFICLQKLFFHLSHPVLL